MALVWEHWDNGTHYEVRSAGSSLRLYTNGAFHSQHSDKHIFTGAIWDLLTVPACFINPSSVLMLGVGGGAAIHQINKLLAPQQIVGVEFNPIHLEVAQDIFKVEGPNIKLELADAKIWVEAHHSLFDVVVDDLFIDTADDPERPFELDGSWLSELEGKVAQNGVLIQNHLSRSAATASANQLRNHFASALLLSVPQYENVVLALYRQPVNRRQAIKRFEQKLHAEHPGAINKLRYQIRQYF